MLRKCNFFRIMVVGEFHFVLTECLIEYLYMCPWVLCLLSKRLCLRSVDNFIYQQIYVQQILCIIGFIIDTCNSYVF